MAALLKLKSGVTVVWGSTEVATGTVAGYGIVRSASKKRDSQKEIVPDNDGAAAAVVYFDFTDDIDIEISCKSSMTVPTIGANLTVAGVTGQVQDYTFKWEQKGVKVFSVTVKHWDNI